MTCCILTDTNTGMNSIKMSELFARWLSALRDNAGRAHIVTRINRARKGNWGDCRPLGGGLNEMRVHYGPGYRLYYTRKGETVYFLLIGGDKSSQEKDIARARMLMEE